MKTEVYKNLVEGDRILFNDRKEPLEVLDIEDDRVLIKGSQGGKYQIYLSEDDKILFSDRDSKRYASYCRNLRKVGRWEKNENIWKHTKTGASLKLQKNELGYWEINIEGLEVEIDQPRYGYSEKEEAVKDLKKIIKKKPEGKSGTI